MKAKEDKIETTTAATAPLKKKTSDFEVLKQLQRKVEKLEGMEGRILERVNERFSSLENKMDRILNILEKRPVPEFSINSSHDGSFTIPGLSFQHAQSPSVNIPTTSSATTIEPPTSSVTVIEPPTSPVTAIEPSLSTTQQLPSAILPSFAIKPSTSSAPVPQLPSSSSFASLIAESLEPSSYTELLSSQHEHSIVIPEQPISSFSPSSMVETMSAMAFKSIKNQFPPDILKTHNINGGRGLLQLDIRKIWQIKRDVLVACGGNDTQWNVVLKKLHVKLKNYRNNCLK